MLQGIAELEGLNMFQELLCKFVIDGRLNIDPGPGTACLTVVETVPHKGDRSGSGTEEVTWLTRFHDSPTLLLHPNPHLRR